MQYRSLLNVRYSSSITQVDELLAIFRYLDSSSEIPAKENILRASLTMLVSTIDTSVHELVIRAILIELEKGNSIFTLDKQLVNVKCIMELDLNNRLRMVEADLRKQLSKESFQSSRQIESVLASIGITKIWSKLSIRFNKTAEEIKLKLDLMVKRRNQVVHEADLDPLHNIQSINIETINDLYLFTTLFVNGIFDEFDLMINNIPTIAST